MTTLNKSAITLAIAAALSPSLIGQARPDTQATYTFRTVAQPGTTIDGHAFTKDTTIDGAAMNDAGEIAFVATDTNAFRGTSVFTSHRIVARHGDVIDGKTIMQILSEPLLQINASGQIAYMAWYAETSEELRVGEPAGLGVFVDRHFILRVGLIGSSEPTPDFALADDGRIVPKVSTSPLSKKTSLMDRVHPRMPRGLPISITPKRPMEARPAMPTITPPFPTNRSGQILIPVNFDKGGFLLLLGMPKAK